MLADNPWCRNDFEPALAPRLLDPPGCAFHNDHADFHDSFSGRKRSVTMFGSIGMPELIIIFVIALIIFGPRKLPELGRTLGKSLSEFRRASNELKSTLEEEIRLDEQKTTAPAIPPAPAQSTEQPNPSSPVYETEQVDSSAPAYDPEPADASASVQDPEPADSPEAPGATDDAAAPQP